MRANAWPPQPRESSPAHHLTTGPGAEDGGGWPMHATAQPWHAEGRPLPTGALPVPARTLRHGWNRQGRCRGEER